MPVKQADVVIVGAGAAGLATAIFATRRAPALSPLLLDGAKRVGAKILVSGGGRCNVTNRCITADDFRGGNRHVIRRILAELPVDRTVAFFREIGVTLHEEEHGKLFPDSHSAKTVLAALLVEAERGGVHLLSDQRVERIDRCDRGFSVQTATTHLTARHVVLATGGRSLPKSGSDGFGFELARRLGHSLIAPVPALAPLVLEGDFHQPLSGISHDADIHVRVEGERPTVIRGALLWTHFGVSGPAVLDASGLWSRARQEHRTVSLVVNFVPGESFESTEARLLELARQRPREHLGNALSTVIPARVAGALLEELGIDGAISMAHLARDVRRRLLHALRARPLPVIDTRGFNYAEVTSGGVPLGEVDPATMASRVCPGLFLVGEILHVDGRIGGFNFQWAWSTAWVAAGGLARKH